VSGLADRASIAAAGAAWQR